MLFFPLHIYKIQYIFTTHKKIILMPLLPQRNPPGTFFEDLTFKSCMGPNLSQSSH